MKLDYFYGGQTERVMKHLIRMFSEFQVQDGFDNGEPRYRRVPCRAGDISRQAAVVIKENSENKMPSAPFMTVTITNMTLKREETKAPMSEQTVVGVNRQNEKGQYVEDLEGYIEVDRYNPVAWKIDFAVDIWTTNQQNKFELFEQIATVFSPTVPFQLSNNPLDQTSFSYVEMKGYNHTSRSFPQGTDHNLDISQFQFETTMYLSLPAKVNRAKLISQIVTNINVKGIEDLELPTLTNWKTVSTDVFSPGNHRIAVERTNTENLFKLTLLNKYGAENDPGITLSWENLLDYYNSDVDDIVEIRLLDQLEGDNSQIIGDFELSEEENVGFLTVDPMTMDSVDFTFSKYIAQLPALSLNPADNVGTYIWHESGGTIDVNGETLEPEMIVHVTSEGYEFEQPVEGAVAQSLSNGRRYKYLKEIGWHEIIKTQYDVGLWRIGFRPQS